ncbi:MAG: Ldh family oxidoreductase [Acidimicrobiia bacterium]|nr:Ldh family oxidoreductase [Acidimicrobiia bacterium]
MIRTAAELEQLATEVLMSVGTAEPAARSVATALVRANKDGLNSHGLARLKAYSAQVAAGKVNGEAVPGLEKLGPSAVRIDARDGFAFPAFDLAIDTLVAMTAETPVAGASVTNSHHFGVAGHHVERLAERGVVGLVFGNSPKAIAPWGGFKPLFGTNPIAFGFPRAEGPPVVVDLSLSKQARGKVKLAADEGRPIPEGWALDADGNPTTDAAAAMGGSMVPLGDAKGAALVLAVEIMAAAMTGAHFGYEASSFFDDQGGPPRVGQFILGFNPGPLSGGTYGDRLEELLAAVTDQPGTRIPGMRRLGIRDDSESNGIDIPDDLLAWMESKRG